MSVDLGSIFVKLGLQDDLSKGFDDAAKSIQKGSQQMISAGKTLSTAVTLPILAMSAALIKVGADFEAASNTIRVGTGATGAALEGLKGNFEDVFSDIPTSAADASQAIADLNTRLGITGEPLENLSKQVLNVSRIMKEDLGGVISSSTRVFGDWGISVEQQGDKLDLLFKTAQATGIGLSELSNRLVSYGAPLRQLGFSFEEAAAMMGKFEKEGVNTELVLGGMKIALGKFAKEGIADPAAALSGLIDKIKEAGSVGDANAIALEVFGQRAGPDMAAAVREGKFDLDELVNSIANSSDTINQAAEDTLSFSEKLTILKNKTMLAVEPLGTSLLNALEKLYPAFEKLTDVLSKVVDFFNSMPDVIQYTTFAFVALAAAIGPVLFVVGTLINSMASLTIAVSGSTIAMGALELVTYSAGVAFGALTVSGGAAAITMTALNTAAYGVGVAFGALEVAAYGAGVAFGTLEVAILGSTAAIAGITIALGAAVIALGAVAYKTFEYQKAAAELKRLDMETSTQGHAEALQKVKNILGDVSNGQQAYNKVMEKGIDNILATKEGHEEIISVLKLLSEEQMALTDRRADEVKVLNELKEAGARDEEIKAQQKVIDNIDISIAETRNYKTEINNATKAAGENKTAVGGIVSELEDATKAAGDYKAALDGTLPEILPEDVKASHQAFVDSVEAATEESNRIYEEGLKERSEKTKQIVKETGDFEKIVQRDTLLSAEEVYQKQFNVWYEYENQKINLKQKLIELDKLENGNITSLAEEKAYLEDIYSLQENMVSELSKQGEVYRLKLNSGQSLSKIEQEILGQYVEEKKTLEQIGLQIEDNRSKRMQEYEDNLKILDTVNEILVREGKITQEEADREAAGYKQRMIDSNKENIAQIIEMVKAGEQLTEWQKELLNLYNQEEADVRNINTALNEKLGIVTQVTSETSKAVQEQEKYNLSVRQGNEESKSLLETIMNITATKGKGTPSGLGEFSSTPGGLNNTYDYEAAKADKNLRSNAGLYGGTDYTAKYNENRENQLSQQASNNIIGQNYISNRIAEVGTTFAPPEYMSPSNSSQVSNNTNNSKVDNSKVELTLNIDGSRQDGANDLSGEVMDNIGALSTFALTKLRGNVL